MEQKRIFLSPSNQTANIGAYGNTNEHEQCLLIAEAAKAYLDANYDCITEIAQRTDNMKTRASYANAAGTDVYIAIHTNAFSDKSVKGTETFYYSADTQGKRLAEALLDKVGALTGVRRRVKPNDSLIELNTPTCTRAYIEVEFHSNPERAEWIKKSTELIGMTIAQCTADFMNLAKKETAPDKDKPAEDEKHEDEVPDCKDRDEKWILENIDYVLDTIAKNVKNTDNVKKYYRVQAGAYSEKENAERLAASLKEAGFNTIIKYC